MSQSEQVEQQQQQQPADDSGGANVDGALGLQFQTMVDDIKTSSKTLSKKRKDMTSTRDALLKSMLAANKRQCMVGKRILVIKDKAKKPGLSTEFHTKAMEAYFLQADGDEQLPADERAKIVVEYVKACQKESITIKETLEVQELPDALADSEGDADGIRQAVVDSFSHPSAAAVSSGSVIEAILSQ